MINSLKLNKNIFSKAYEKGSNNNEEYNIDGKYLTAKVLTMMKKYQTYSLVPTYPM